MLGSDEGVKLVLSGVGFIGTILGNVDGITLGINIGTYMVSLDLSFDGSNDGKLERLFLGDTVRSTDGKVLDPDKDVNQGLSDGKVFGTIIGNVY